MNKSSVLTVESLLDWKEKNGRSLFLVKWKGLGEAENTWEDEEALHCIRLIKRFKKEHKKPRIDMDDEVIKSIISCQPDVKYQKYRVQFSDGRFGYCSLAKIIKESPNEFIDFVVSHSKHYEDED